MLKFVTIRRVERRLLQFATILCKGIFLGHSISKSFFRSSINTAIIPLIGTEFYYVYDFPKSSKSLRILMEERLRQFVFIAYGKHFLS